MYGKFWHLLGHGLLCLYLLYVGIGVHDLVHWSGLYTVWLGAMQKVCHSGEGGGGPAKRWQSVTWGEGVKRKSDVTHRRIQSNQFSFLQFSIFKSPQSFLKINPFWPSKCLKSFLTSYSLADSVAFERSVISFYHRCFHTLVTTHRFPLGISFNTGSF